MSERTVARHAPGARRITYRQVFMGSLIAVAVVYVAFSFWVLFSPTTLPTGTVLREPVLLVIVPTFMIFLAAVTAVILTAVWWICWGWWHPVERPAAPPRQLDSGAAARPPRPSTGHRGNRHGRY